jgi:hypothetical protein
MLALALEAEVELQADGGVSAPHRDDVAVTTSPIHSAASQLTSRIRA